jgi:hypothetical protein
MPNRQTMERAKQNKRQGKSPGTQAGEFIRAEIHHVREGKHGARSAKQVIAIGLSKARRAGVGVAAPKKGTVSAETRRKAVRDTASGNNLRHRVSHKRSQAVKTALKREGRSAASKTGLARQARAAAKRRTAAERSAAARRDAKTKGPVARSMAAKKAARTRAKHRG